MIRNSKFKHEHEVETIFTEMLKKIGSQGFIGIGRFLQK